LGYIPYYVLQYVKELTKFFHEILIVTNEREILNADKFPSNKTQLMQVKNEGYDLGMFVKAFTSLKFADYQQIACVNDSNILLRKLNFLFEWADNQHLGMWGLMDSHEKTNYSSHQDNHHVQSHFLVFNESVFPTLQSYFDELDLRRIITTKDLQQVKKTVINDWEIGVSQYLLKHGHQVGAYFHREDYINKREQPHIEMLLDGMPTLKKKIITSVKPRDLFAGKNYWSKLVKNYAGDIVNLEKLLPELKRIRRDYLANAARQLVRKLIRI
jgi:hypothetical protein